MSNFIGAATLGLALTLAGPICDEGTRVRCDMPEGGWYGCGSSDDNCRNVCEPGDRCSVCNNVSGLASWLADQGGLALWVARDGRTVSAWLVRPVVLPPEFPAPGVCLTEAEVVVNGRLTQNDVSIVGRLDFSDSWARVLPADSVALERAVAYGQALAAAKGMSLVDFLGQLPIYGGAISVSVSREVASGPWVANIVTEDLALVAHLRGSVRVGGRDLRSGVVTFGGTLCMRPEEVESTGVLVAKLIDVLRAAHEINERNRR